MNAIIGITGQIGAGKNAVAKWLIDKGYVHIVLSDEVRKEVIARGLPPTRENFQNTGDEVRRTYGNDIFAQRTASHIRELRAQGKADKIIIDGIRNTEEITLFREAFGMKLIGVTADAELRFKRLVERGRPGDPLSWEDFENIERRERGIGTQEYGLHIDNCMGLADIIIENNGTQQELDEKLREIALNFGIEGNVMSKEGQSLCS